MISIDSTNRKKPCYEVIISYGELEEHIYYHDYVIARMFFNNVTNQRIKGLSIWIKDLTGITDC